MDITVSKDLIISNLTPEQRQNLKEIMSFTNPAWSDAIQFGRSTEGLEETIRLFEEQDNSISIPRGSLYKVISSLGLPSGFKSGTASFEKKEVASNIVLRELQKPWVQSMLMHKQGIGVAPAGSGKTVMALNMIASIGQPTLWLTHRQELVTQFKERAGFFFEGEKDIGIIGGGKLEVGNFLTVGMIQTIAKQDLKELSHKFGVVIIDECHCVPCTQATKSVRKFAPEYLYGLTATPYREDKLEQIMLDVVGPIIASMDREAIIEANDIMPASVQVRKTGISYPRWGKNAHDFNKIMEYLTHNDKRNIMIVKDILTEIVYGSICIVLTSRVSHGALLKDIIVGCGVDCEHIHGKFTKKQRKIKLDRFMEGEVPLIIATYKLLAEGFDHKPTNRIFFALPYKAKGLIEQSKGRIERISEGKEDAIVYDYVDNIPMLERQFEIRCEQYHEHNLKILY
jgi:superfamily II DNA or RNA helicase